MEQDWQAIQEAAMDGQWKWVMVGGAGHMCGDMEPEAVREARLRQNALEAWATNWCMMACERIDCKNRRMCMARGATAPDVDLDLLKWRLYALRRGMRPEHL